MRKVFRFASLPSITSYIRYYRKMKIYVCLDIWMHECLCECRLHIILFHYLLHQNVNTHIVIFRKKTYSYRTVVEPRQHPSFILSKAFSSVFCIKLFHCASLTLSLFLSYSFWFYLPWREQIAKGLPWTIFIEHAWLFCIPLHLHISYIEEKALVNNKIKKK